MWPNNSNNNNNTNNHNNNNTTNVAEEQLVVCSQGDWHRCDTKEIITRKHPQSSYLHETWKKWQIARF